MAAGARILEGQGPAETAHPLVQRLRQQPHPEDRGGEQDGDVQQQLPLVPPLHQHQNRWHLHLR